MENIETTIQESEKKRESELLELLRREARYSTLGLGRYDRDGLNDLTQGAFKNITPDPDKEDLKPVLEKVKERYKYLLSHALDFENRYLDYETPGGRVQYIRKALTIYELFNIGDTKEIIDAFLKINKFEHKRGHNIYGGVYDIVKLCLKYEYFPDDQAIKGYARRYIRKSLEEYKKRYEHTKIAYKFKQKVLEDLNTLVKNGILNEDENADIIDDVTSL